MQLFKLFSRALRKYFKLLSGQFAGPSSKREGLIFQGLFAFVTAVAMILSINVIVVGSPIAHALKLLATLPIWFAIAFAIRSLFANKLSFWLQAHLVTPYFAGAASQALFVFINVCIMAPIMCVFGTAFGIVMSGSLWAAFPTDYLVMLPKAAAIAYALVFLLVKPLVSYLFSDVYRPTARKIRAWRAAHATE